MNRVRLDTPPVSSPCWYPGTASRVLYAGGGGRLYQYTFEDADENGGEPIEGKAEPIAWRNFPAGMCDAVIEDPVWPKDPRFGGRLFVTISFLRKRERGGALPYEIWWLQLDAAGTTIVDGGRLATDAVDGVRTAQPARDERFPRVTTTPDGGLAMAYQVRDRGGSKGELRVVRVEFDPQTDAPTIRHAEAHKVVEGCAATPPAFTPDGLGVFALLGVHVGPSTLQRFTFAGSLPPPSPSSLVQRSSARRSLTYRVPSLPRAAHPG